MVVVGVEGSWNKSLGLEPFWLLSNILIRTLPGLGILGMGAVVVDNVVALVLVDVEPSFSFSLLIVDGLGLVVVVTDDNNDDTNAVDLARLVAFPPFAAPPFDPGVAFPTSFFAEGKVIPKSSSSS